MTKIEELQIYRENEGINQSFLKSVANNQTKEEKDETDAMRLGSLVDVLTLTPELQDEFYYFSKCEKYPSPQYKETLDKAFQISQEWDITLLLEQFRSISGVKTRDDIIIEKLNQCQDYWQDLIDSQGKQVITLDYWNTCNNARLILQTHPFTKHHFENTLFADIQYQVPIYDEIDFEFPMGVYKPVKRKGLLDLFIIDEAHKTVQFKDLKTTSATPEEWFRQAKQFRYDFQVSWYYDIIQQLYPDYRQLMPELIVYSFASPNKPFTKVITLDDLKTGRDGFVLQKAFVEYEKGIAEPIEEKYLGWEDCLRRYLICTENGFQDWDVDYWVNQGVVNKNIF